MKISKVGRKFAIGYQMGGEMTSDDWIEVISRHRESILEVYFAMPGDMSGRAPAGLKLEERKTDGLLEAFWNDLERLKAMDVSGVMLFNSACYGVDNQSQKLLEHVGKIGCQTRHFFFEGFAVVFLFLDTDVPTGRKDIILLGDILYRCNRAEAFDVFQRAVLERFESVRQLLDIVFG